MEKKIIVRRSSAHPNTQNVRIWSTGQKEMNKLIYSISILKIKILIELLSLRWTFFTACYPEHNVLPCLYTSLLCLVLMYAVEKKSKTCHYLRAYWDDVSRHIEMLWKPPLFNTSAYASAAEPRWHNHCFFVCVCLPHRTTIAKEGNSKVHFKKLSKQRTLLTDVLCFNMFP